MLRKHRFPESRTGSPAGLRSRVGKTPGEIHRGTTDEILKDFLGLNTVNNWCRARIAALQKGFTGEKDGKTED